MKRWMSCLVIVAVVMATATVAFAHCGKCGVGDEPKKHDDHDIVDTALEADNFKVLATALAAADLIETLKSEGPFTVFAPTDEAFEKLPEGTMKELFKPENKEKLIGILTYHVLPGKHMAADVMKLDKAKTVQGSELMFEMKDGKFMIGGASLLKADIPCANGVIHAIDMVILPKEKA